MERNLTGTLHREAVAPASDIRTLKPWAYDAGMIADNYSVTKRLVLINGEWVAIGQFSLINLYMEDANGWVNTWSANELFSELTHDELMKIKALQIADEYSVDTKMGWLTNGGPTGTKWISPMRLPDGGDWRTANRIQMIGATYAGEKVEVIDRQEKTISFNGKTETVWMVRINTFKPSDWGKTWFTHPHLVQRVTAVDSGDGVIKPKGIIYLPLITRHASCWILERWLK